MLKPDCLLILAPTGDPILLRPVSSAARQWALEAFKGRDLGTPLSISLQAHSLSGTPALDPHTVVSNLQAAGLRLMEF